MQKAPHIGLGGEGRVNCCYTFFCRPCTLGNKPTAKTARYVENMYEDDVVGVCRELTLDDVKTLPFLVFFGGLGAEVGCVGR